MSLKKALHYIKKAIVEERFIPISIFYVAAYAVVRWCVVVI